MKRQIRRDSWYCWVFYKCGRMKPKIWSMLFLAGMIAQAYDLIMLRGFEYSFIFTLNTDATIFSLATLYFFLGTMADIFDMALETIKDKN